MNRLLLVLLILLANFISTSAYSKELPKKIKIASPDNFLPVVIGKKVLNIAYQKIGVEVEFIDLPAKRSLMKTNLGEFDGEVHRIWEIAKNYPNLIRVPTAINYLDEVVYSNRKIEIKSCEDLVNLSVGIRRGVKHAEQCSRYAREVFIFNEPNRVMKILDKKRIDLVISSRFNGLRFENNDLYPNIMLITPPLKRHKLYHYLHKSNAILVEEIDKALSLMAESGELEAIREQVMLDYKNTPN